MVPSAPSVRTVLLVEESALLQHHALKLLRRWGYGSLSAFDVEDALRVVANHQGVVDVAILSLPAGACRRKLADLLQVRFPGIRVVAIDGWEKSRQLTSALSALEPPTPQELTARDPVPG